MIGSAPILCRLPQVAFQSLSRVATSFLFRVPLCGTPPPPSASCPRAGRGRSPSERPCGPGARRAGRMSGQALVGASTSLTAARLPTARAPSNEPRHGARRPRLPPRPERSEPRVRICKHRAASLELARTSSASSAASGSCVQAPLGAPRAARCAGDSASRAARAYEQRRADQDVTAH
jgi:hypothetical protein